MNENDWATMGTVEIVHLEHIPDPTRAGLCGDRIGSFAFLNRFDGYEIGGYSGGGNGTVHLPDSDSDNHFPTSNENQGLTYIKIVSPIVF